MKKLIFRSFISEVSSFFLISVFQINKYIFIRGIPETNRNYRRTDEKTPGLIIEKAPIERLITLDQLLKNGGE